MSVSPQTTSTTSPAASTPPTFWQRFPNWITSVVVTVCLTLIALVRIFAEQIETVVPFFDGAVVNLVTLLLSFLTCVTLYIWFCWFSEFNFMIRRIGFALPLAAIVMAVAALRYEGVDGYMVPTFVPQWQPRHKYSLVNVSPEQQPAISESGNSEAPALKLTADLLTETADDFPQFLGPQRNNYLPGLQIAADWKANPPREMWRRDIGPGWSGFVVRNGFAVTMEQRGGDEWVSCYRVATGDLIWHHASPARHYNAMGGLGPRSTPTIDGGRVYAQGSTGIVSCLDGATGKRLWKDDLLDRYHLTQAEGEQSVMWGRSGSPLIVGNLVVVPAGGKDSDLQALIAFDKESGQVAWEAGDEQISYASPVLATLGGVEQIISVNEKSLAGYDAKSGKELWKHKWPGNSNADANVSQAFPLASDRIFLSKGYGAGSVLLQLKNESETFSVTPVWESRRVLKTKYTNVTIIKDHAYGLSDGILECVDLETGKSRWKGGRYGHGQVLGVGDQVLVLGEDGDLMLVAANPEKFQEQGKIEALPGKTWNNLCISGKRLLLRNGTQAVCYELP